MFPLLDKFYTKFATPPMLTGVCAVLVPAVLDGPADDNMELDEKDR